MKQANPFQPRRNLVRAAVMAALPFMLAGGRAYADCAGSVAAPNSNAVSVLCNNSGASTNGNLTVSDSTTYVDTTNAGSTSYVAGGNKILVQFDGHGRTLTVDEGAQLSNFRNVAGSRTAVTMGASTQDASANTTFAVEPDVGTSTVTLTNTPGSTWVGQSLIFGRFDEAGGDFIPGQSYVITAVDGAAKTVTVEGSLASDFQGSGDDSLPLVYSVVSNYGQGSTVNGVFYNNIINNAGTISSRVQLSELNPAATTVAAPYNSAIYGIRTSVAGAYLIDNSASGVIRVSHAGIGNSYGIEEGGNVTRLDVNNAGLVEAERTQALTLITSTIGGATVKSSDLSFNAGNLGQANAINTQEEADQFNLNNAETGVIRALGDYNGAIYMRAAEKNIVNDGLIEHVSSAGGTDYGRGFAIGSVSDGGEVRELTLTNNGTINGDVLAVNGNALRWYLLSTVGDSSSNPLGSAEAITAGLDSRLTISNQTGQENSQITNNGTIVGNLWLGNGEHALENTGTLTGNIDVEQRDTTYGTVSGSTINILPGSEETVDPVTGEPGPSNNTDQGGGFVIRGNKSFEFTNEGTFNGNLNITNASSSFSGEYGTETIAGTVSSENSIVNSGIFNGNITINDVAGANNEITLVGGGFNGNISASTGEGNNTLNLQGEGTLSGDVLNFTTLNLGQSADSGASADDDDEEDAAPAADDAEEPVPPSWTLAAGKTFGFSDGAYLNEGTLNVLGNLQANTFVGVGATLTGSGTITGDLTNSGTVDLGLNTLTVDGDAVFNPGSVLRVQLASQGNGKLAVAHEVNFQPGAKLQIDHRNMLVRNGQSFNVLTHNALPNLPQVQGNGLLDWNSIDSNGNFNLTAQVNGFNVAGISTAGAKTLNALMSFDSLLGRQAQNLSTEAKVLALGEQLRPEINGAVTQSTLNVGNIVLGMLYNRLNDTHFAQANGKQYFGEKTDQGLGVWLQGIGLSANQSTYNGVQGYNGNTWGIGFGADTLLGESRNLRVGAAFNYANSTLTDNGPNQNNQTTFDSYLGTVYGSLLFQDGWYLNGALAVGQHDYSGTRMILNGAANANYDAWQYLAHVDGGMPFSFQYATLTPVLGFTYSHLSQDGYQERGLAALRIGGMDTDSFRSSLGGKALIPLIQSKVNTSLELHTIWNHEYLNTSQNINASFVAGGTAFNVNGVSPARDSVDVGASLRISGSYKEFRPSILATYNAGIKDQYLGNTGYLRAMVEF